MDRSLHQLPFLDFESLLDMPGLVALGVVAYLLMFDPGVSGILFDSFWLTLANA
jgi:hypothetical protein